MVDQGVSLPFADLQWQVEILSPVAYGESEFRPRCMVKLFPAITTTPVFPGLFDRIVQALPIVRTKDVPIRFFMNRSIFRLHSSAPLLG